MNKDLILKKGDIVTCKTTFNTIVNFMITNREGETIESLGYNVNSILKVKRPTKYETIYEVKEILDEVEKKWLGNFVKPFRSKIYDIVKYRLYDNSGEWLQIRMKDSPDIDLPYFKLNKMYKGMKINREYTLEELGL